MRPVPPRPPVPPARSRPAARLAPALGLTAACVLLTAIGAFAVATADSPHRPTEFAGAIPLLDAAPLISTSPASGFPTAGPTQPTSRPVNSVAAAPDSSAPASNPGALAGSHAHQSASPQDYAFAVFEAVNRARAAQHLHPLAWDGRLQESARSHNRAMAGSDTLSHQVDSEPPLGSRESAAGVRWSYAAENIGWTTERSLAGLLDIEGRMLAETAPNDAHRRNILSVQAQSLGVDVYLDAVHGRWWLTEDFAGN